MIDSAPIRLVGERYEATAGRMPALVRLAVPFRRGLLRSLEGVQISTQAGPAVACQQTTLEHWPDGTVRWASVEFFADAGAAGYYLSVGPCAQVQAAPGPLSCSEQGPLLTIETGAAAFMLRIGQQGLFHAVWVGGIPALDADRSAITFTDATGRAADVSAVALRLAACGPLRAAVEFEASVDRQPHLRIRGTLEFFAGSAAVRVSLTCHNTRRAVHEGGIWVLGDPGSVTFSALTVGLTAPVGVDTPRAVLSVGPGEAAVDMHGGFSLRQWSSGGESWNSPVHVDHEGEVRLPFRGYRLVDGDGREVTGLRATPVGAVAAGNARITIAAPLFWQNFPKQLDATGRGLSLSLFPQILAVTHELQGGEQKTHTFAVGFSRAESDIGPEMECFRNPLVAVLPADWYDRHDAMALLPGAASSEPERLYDALAGAAVDGPDAFPAKIDAHDEYGWRHFGDLPADHEAVGEAGRSVRVSHYNNQYDAVSGFAAQFLRTGDARWWCLMRDLAEHVADIDIYHTSEDKSAFNGGPFWHTAHYTDAATSTHRCYPRLPGVAGGGPSNEHCYTYGLLLHHLLTGSPVSKSALLEVAAWVLGMDDGTKTVFRWLAPGDTGLASSTAEAAFHGPGRGAGNAIFAMVNADRIDPDGPWMAKAEQLVRRCIHPTDDVDRRELLDAERRWSYTVFLQALVRYVERKVERAEDRDDSTQYAVAGLLHYARWMRVHEYPYLERSDRLEYPNETWPAQDMRKAEVFQAAAALTGGADSAAFAERADFFFDYAVRWLSQSESASSTRPTVLVLAQGLRARGGRGGRRLDALGIAATHSPPLRWPPASAFEPQKARAMRRAKLLAALAALVGMAVAVGASVWAW